MAVKPPVIAGKYTLLRKLGAGGMAEVFLAKQAGMDGFEKLVVIKRILPQHAGNQEFVSMFLAEARLAADLRHPNIVSIFDIDSDVGVHYIAMEFLHGKDIRRVQRRLAQWKEYMPLPHGLQMIIDAANGLHYAHIKRDLHGNSLGIVHRDVSPQNIIVTFDGNTRIVDFGIAKAANQTSETQSGVLKGKYTYMSPEQAAGDPIDHRTDQFALGIVLWELLTMHRLFKRESDLKTLQAVVACEVPRPSMYARDLPKELEEIVMTALAPDKRRRFKDCEAFAEALEDFLLRKGLAHSSSRLARYMRRLFADSLAEEASLGASQLDGGAFVWTAAAASSMLRAEVESTREERPRPRTLADGMDKNQNRSAARPKTERADVEKFEKAEPKTNIADKTRADKSQVAPAPNRTPPPTPHTHATIQGTDLNKPGAGQTAIPTVAVQRSEPLEQQRSSWGRYTIPLFLGATVLLGGTSGAMVAIFAGKEPKKGSVIVRSDPKGAAIFLDGQPTGQVTPALLRDLAPDEPHEIKLTADGYLPAVRHLTLTAEDTAKKDAMQVLMMLSQNTNTPTPNPAPAPSPSSNPNAVPPPAPSGTPTPTTTPTTPAPAATDAGVVNPNPNPNPNTNPNPSPTPSPAPTGTGTGENNNGMPDGRSPDTP